MRPEHLSRHRLNHRPCKVFACSRCPKRFVRLDLYQRHRARHDKGMHFRNTGGVVGGDIQAQTILEEKPSPAALIVAENSPNHVGDPSKGSAMTQVDTRGTGLTTATQLDDRSRGFTAATPQVEDRSRGFSTAPPIEDRSRSFSTVPLVEDRSRGFPTAPQVEDISRSFVPTNGILPPPPPREHYPSPMESSGSMLATLHHQPTIPGAGFTYGSPPDDPETLFFDESANIWDLPDNLEWFFEAPNQNALAMTDPSLAFGLPSFLSPVANLPPFQESLGLPFSMPTTENCWFTVQSRLLQSLSSVQQDLHPHFFNPGNLAMCYNLYFENYHPHFPIIHRPTLVVTEAEPLLLAAIITLGSTLSSDELIYEIGQKIHNNLRWIIFKTGKFEPPCPLWCLQALLLVQAQAKMSSTRKNYEMAHIFHGAIITMMKRGRVYCPSLEPAGNQHTTLDLSWLQWAQQEASRRTAFFAFIMDAQHSSVFGHTPVLSVSDLRLPLPCAESLWECSTATQWHDHSQRIPKSPQFLLTLKGILGKAPPVTTWSDYSRLILLHGFLSLITNMHARESATLGIGSTKTHVKDPSGSYSQMDDWVDIISRAMGVWSFSLLSLEPSLCLEAARPLYRMAYITLHSNIVDFHILARDPALLDNPLSKREWTKAETRLKAWSRRQETKQAVLNSLLLIKETVLTGKRYVAREDNVAARPWCLYIAILLLWCYGQTVEGDPETADSTLPAEEYLARMLTELENGGDVARYAKKTRGLTWSMKYAFKECRWELLQEAYKSLCQLSGT